jgi:hypothetical protein
LCLLLAFTFFPPAAATTIIFGSGGTAGFDGTGDLGTSISGSIPGGLTLTIVASGCTTGPCIITSSTTGGGSGGFGFGVNNANGATNGSNPAELGGPPELLTLIFSATVTLTGFSLEDVDDNSDNGVIFLRSLPSAFTITNVQNLTDGANPPGSVYNSAASTYASEIFAVNGTQFTVSASAGEVIRLRSISYDLYTPEPPVNTLIGLGLVGLWALSRWRRPAD